MTGVMLCMYVLCLNSRKLSVNHLRYGRVKFSKVTVCMYVYAGQSLLKKSNEVTPLLQEKLIKKLAENNNVFPFIFRLPDSAPTCTKHFSLLAYYSA